MAAYQRITSSITDDKLQKNQKRTERAEQSTRPTATRASRQCSTQPGDSYFEEFTYQHQEGSKR